MPQRTETWWTSSAPFNERLTAQLWEERPDAVNELRLPTHPFHRRRTCVAPPRQRVRDGREGRRSAPRMRRHRQRAAGAFRTATSGCALPAYGVREIPAGRTRRTTSHQARATPPAPTSTSNRAQRVPASRADRTCLRSQGWPGSAAAPGRHTRARTGTRPARRNSSAGRFPTKSSSRIPATAGSARRRREPRRRSAAGGRGRPSPCEDFRSGLTP